MFIWNKEDLNEGQENAIFEKNSVLLIACPGSGKTRTLTYKVGYELSKLKSEKEYIVAITYTNAAADEIKDRIELLGVDTSQLWIGTIHAFCLEWILRPYSLYLNELKHGFRVLNSHETEELITELCKPYKQKKVTYWDCSFIAKSTGYRITSLDKEKHKTIKKILTKYFEILKNNNQIDFEQILFYSLKLLKKKPHINSILSKLFPFILIDEYQDTKEIQYHIISFILKKGKTKTLIVGDPNQSIYENLGGFPMDQSKMESLIGFPLIEYNLSNNYRSSKKIIRYFDQYKTFPNSIIPAGKNKDYKSIVTFNNTVSKTSLEDEIVRLILFNIEEIGILPREICIAGPQWIPLANLTRSLMVKMPDYSFDGPGMAPFARDIDNFWYKLSRIVLTEPSPILYMRRLRWSKEILVDLANAGVDVSTVTTKRFLKLCNSIVLDETNGIKYLELLFKEICNRLQINISAFLTLEEHYHSFFRSSENRIERLEKKGNTDIGNIESFKKVFKQKEGITISTIHGIKGEEYDTLICFGLLNNWVPHFKDNNGSANSKKMLYVLSSRARKNLHLVSETGRNINFYNPNGLMPTPHLSGYKYDYDELE